MKKTVLVLLLTTFSLLAYCQRNSDIGIFTGVSYYFGDINAYKQFYRPQFAFGGLYRYNINNRYALKVGGYYGHLKASDADFSDRVIVGRNPDAEINATIFDLAAQVEFNFMPYITGEKNSNGSTYITGGVGYYHSNYSQGIAIPFGVGYKFNITNRLSAGAEWTLRKTFSDKIDDVENPLGNNAFNNNDWYSFAGLFITYKFFNFAADCPVYN